MLTTWQHGETKTRRPGFPTKPVSLVWHPNQVHENPEDALASHALRRCNTQRGKMQGIKGYRWSRCNVARGNVSCIVAPQCLLEDDFNLKTPLPRFHMIIRNISKLMLHTLLYRQWIVFLKARIFQEFTRFISRNLPILALKGACVRALITLNINYTQLTVKVKFFFKKERLFQKIWHIDAVFECSWNKVSVISAAGNRTLWTYSSCAAVSAASPFKFLRLRVTFLLYWLFARKPSQRTIASSLKPCET